MRPLNLRFRAGGPVAGMAIVATLLGSVIAYRRFIEPPFQPAPEVVAEGLIPLPFFFPLVCGLILFAVVVAAWRWRLTR